MRQIAIKYGILMFAGFSVFFIVMHWIGQSQNYNLRIFNALIHLGLIALAIRAYRQSYPESKANYISGVATGMYASIIGVLPFSIFMALWLTGDTAFLNHIKESIPIGEYLNPILISLFLFVEGIAISLIGSYILTRIIDMVMAGPKAWEKFRR